MTTAIPRFYFGKTVENEPIYKKLHSFVCNTLVKKESKKLPSIEELNQLEKLLLDNKTPSTAKDEESRISFLAFLKTHKQLNQSKFDRFFKPNIFLKMPCDEKGDISIMHFYNYVMRLGINIKNDVFLIGFL